MEEWRPIPNFEGYEISDAGNVRSWWKSRRNTRELVVTPHLLLGRPQSSYRRVTLSVEGVKTSIFVHQTILEVFVGPRPKGKWALHRNGVKLQNRLDNLYWGTPKQNAEDRELHGNTMHGAKNPNVKLTERDVISIREQYALGARQVDLAEAFAITQAQVSSITLGKSWKHI